MRKTFEKLISHRQCLPASQLSRGRQINRHIQDQPTFFWDPDPIGEEDSLVDVVRHQQDRWVYVSCSNWEACGNGEGPERHR